MPGFRIVDCSGRNEPITSVLIRTIKEGSEERIAALLNTIMNNKETHKEFLDGFFGTKYSVSALLNPDDAALIRKRAHVLFDS